MKELAPVEPCGPEPGVGRGEPDTGGQACWKGTTRVDPTPGPKTDPP
jgi:hypothetical protein